MNIDALKMFITIVQQGSISKAAQQLGYAQSNISTKVQQLENELQTKLFYRSVHGVTLTDTGTELYRQAIKLVHLNEETINRIKHPHSISGTLKIGTLQTAASTFLPQLLANYHQKNPQVELSIATGTTATSTQRVLNYELDGAIIGGRINEKDLLSIPLMEEEVCLITSKDSQIDIKNDSLLVFPVGCAYRKILETWLDSQQIMIHHPIEFNYLNAIIASVSAGLGISVLPKQVAQPYLDSKVINAIPLPKEFSTLPVSFIYRKDRLIDQAFKTFLTEIKK